MLTDNEIVEIRNHVWKRYRSEDVAQTVIEEIIRQRNNPTACTDSVKNVEDWKIIGLYLAKHRIRAEHFFSKLRPHINSEFILTSTADPHSIEMIDEMIDAKAAITILMNNSSGAKLVRYVIEGHDPNNLRKTRKSQGFTREWMRQIKESMRELLTTKGLL